VSDNQSESQAVLDRIKENDLRGAFEGWKKNDGIATYVPKTTISKGTWFSRLGVGCKAEDRVLWKIYFTKSKEVKTGSMPAEFSTERCGPKTVILLVMMMIR
jgi:hypothetical protein